MSISAPQSQVTTETTIATTRAQSTRLQFTQQHTIHPGENPGHRSWVFGSAAVRSIVSSFILSLFSQPDSSDLLHSLYIAQQQSAHGRRRTLEGTVSGTGESLCYRGSKFLSPALGVWSVPFAARPTSTTRLSLGTSSAGDSRSFRQFYCSTSGAVSPFRSSDKGSSGRRAE